MAWDDSRRTKRCELIEAPNPGFNAGPITVEAEKAAIHDDIAGEKHIVALDEYQSIAVGVGAAVPGNTGTHASQVENFLGIEEFVGAPELRVLHQIRHRRRSRREVGLYAEFINVPLLRPGANHFCRRRK